jgi:hypothetical protein
VGEKEWTLGRDIIAKEVAKLKIFEEKREKMGFLALFAGA